MEVEVMKEKSMKRVSVWCGFCLFLFFSISSIGAQSNIEMPKVSLPRIFNLEKQSLSNEEAGINNSDYDSKNFWWKKVECRGENQRTVGFRFILKSSNNSDQVELISFNEESGYVGVVPPAAKIDFTYSENQVYIKHFRRYTDSGMYSEFLIGRFIDQRRPLSLGLFLVTEAFFSKDSEGREVESLSPMSRMKIRCTPF